MLCFIFNTRAWQEIENYKNDTQIIHIFIVILANTEGVWNVVVDLICCHEFAIELIFYKEGLSSLWVWLEDFQLIQTAD